MTDFSPLLVPVAEGTRWPSGDCIDLALLPLTEEQLSARLCAPLVQGTEEGLGPWSGIGGHLPSGKAVEFIFYSMKPKPSGVILRLDKMSFDSATFDEALSLVGLSRENLLYISPCIS